MKNAIAAGDNEKAQTYIHALGNTAHPRILVSYEDYLEGRKKITQFQRFLMVSSLYHIANIHPDISHPLLMKIFQNYAEAEEIRVAAVNHILLSNPPVEILETLATSTRHETNPSVKSAIISGIKSAAEDYSAGNKDEFGRKAQAAKEFLDQEDYGFIPSKTFFYSSTIADDITLKNKLNFIRSRDHYLPQSIFYSVQRSSGQMYDDKIYVAAMASSVNKIFEKLSKKIVNLDTRYNERTSKHQKGESYSYWDAEKISKNIGVKISSEPDVEAHLILNVLGGERAYSFGDYSFESIPQRIKEAYENIKSSPHIEYTLFYSNNDIVFGFPTIMGIPFVYSYTKPTLICLNGEAKLQTHPDISSGNNDHVILPQKINVSLNLEANYVTQTEIKFGILFQFNYREYFASLVTDTEMNTAFESQIYLDSNTNEWEIQIKPATGGRKPISFEYRTLPFTARYNTLDERPALEQCGAESIHVSEPVHRRFRFGHSSTGLAFQYNVMSERIEEDEDLIKFKFFNFDCLKNFPSMFSKRGIHPNYIKLLYDPSLSSANAVTLKFAYKHKFFKSESVPLHNSSHEFPQAVNMEALPSVKVNDNRRRQLLNKVAEGIPGANAYLLDLAVEFERPDQDNLEYLVTASMASSDVSPLFNASFYIGLNPQRSSGKSYEVCASMKSSIPRVPEVDAFYLIRMNSNLTSYFKLSFGVSCDLGVKIDSKIVLSRSEKYRNSKIKYETFLFIYQDLQYGNGLSYTSRTAAIVANMFDNIKIYINSDRSNDIANTDMNNLSSKTSQRILFITPISVWLNRLGINFVYEKHFSQKTMVKNEIEIGNQFSSDFKYVNITIRQAEEETKFIRAYFDNKNLRIQPYRIIHWLINLARFSPYVNFNLAGCFVSEKYIETFDNASYHVNFGKDWHLLFLYTPKRINPSNNFSNKDSEVVYEDKEENVAMITKESYYGKDVQLIIGDYVIELIPVKRTGSGLNWTTQSPSAQVNINGRPVSFSSEKIATVISPNDEIVVKVFAKPNGEVTVYSPKYGLHIVHLGRNIQVNAGVRYKNNIRGLCGTYDGNKDNDFTTPKNCVLRNATLFAATYALLHGDSSSNIAQLKQQAGNADCYRENIEYDDVITYDEADLSDSINPVTKSCYTSGEIRMECDGTITDDICGSRKIPAHTDKVHTVCKDEGNVCISLKPHQVRHLRKRRYDLFHCLHIMLKDDFYCLKESNNIIQQLKNKACRGDNISQFLVGKPMKKYRFDVKVCADGCT